ncbi:MAG: hypothetical protein JWN56_803 [Sphingobacteriales bacterium]|nr:hypothetical protein [Sphingobacteriales bacterium]
MKCVFTLILFTLVTLGCKKSKSPEPASTLGNADLVAPASNEACTTGRILSADESAILFKWNSAANAETYELVIKNLKNGTTETHTVSATTLELNLPVNTPFSWYIRSKSAKITATSQSAIWKFYNAGQGLVSYAPFPADKLIPAMKQNVTAVNGKITLGWSGEDVDGDIKGYDIYLGENAANPVLLQSDIATGSLSVNVVSNTTYYWKVITKDLKGNQSNSGIYQFTVN